MAIVIDGPRSALSLAAMTEAGDDVRLALYAGDLEDLLGDRLPAVAR